MIRNGELSLVRRRSVASWPRLAAGTRALVAGAFCGLCASPHASGAQSIPGAVLAAKEPHHKPAYEDSTLRVLRVAVPARDSTLLHEHAVDYFWIALGPSEVVNARLGSPDAVIASKDLSIHYTVGKFAHVARNPGPGTFRNITVELLKPQTNVQNRCEEAVNGGALICPSARGLRDLGALERPAFVTDRLRVSLLTLMPGARIQGAGKPASVWYIALNPADANVALQAHRDEVVRGRAADLGHEWRGGTWRAPADGRWRLGNVSSRTISVLEVTSVWP